MVLSLKNCFYLSCILYIIKYEYDNYDSYLWTFIMILFLYETIKYKFTVIINRYLLHMIMVLFSTIKYIMWGPVQNNRLAGS